MDKSFSTMMALFCYIFSFLNLYDTFHRKIYRTSNMQQFLIQCRMGTSLRFLYFEKCSLEEFLTINQITM